MATNGRKRYFHVDENASSGEIYALLDDVESADEDDKDNLMNDPDTEFVKSQKMQWLFSKYILFSKQNKRFLKQDGD